MLPINIAETKTFLKIEHDLEDALLTDIIKAAINCFEDYTSIALLDQVWRVIYKNVRSTAIELPIKPLLNVLSVATSDTNQKIQQITHHRVLGNVLYLGCIPHETLLIIEFQSGFQDINNPIPENIKLALLDHIAFLYENRGSITKTDYSFYSQFRSIKF